VVSEDRQAGASGSHMPLLPLEYTATSDSHLAAARRVPFRDRAQLLRDRQEGMFLVSDETPGGWVALSKDILTDVLGQGRDVKIAGLLTEAAVATLRLLYPSLIVVASKDCR